MNAALTYLEAMDDVLRKIRDTQMDAIQQAARVLADAIARGGMIYTFGTGHSHIIAEDVAYRAGGLACMDAMLEPSLTGHQHVSKSEYMERVEGMAEVMLNYWGVTPQDALVIISNSGRNAAPIEMAMLARERGIPTVGITSLAHSRGTTSRHSSGRKMYEFVDVLIDNQCPLGDALIHLEELPQPTGAGSGVAGLYILQAIVVQTVQNLLERGIEPPVFRSGNLDGSQEFNKKIAQKYMNRMKLW